MKNLTILTLNIPDISDFAKARNDLLKTAKTPWVFFLDTDEIMTPSLAKEIESTILSPRFDAYTVSRFDIFLGKKLMHGETNHTHLIRLAKKDWGTWIRPVHEVWQGDGRVGHLANSLLHTPHKTISSFLVKIDRYSTLDASHRFYNNKRSSLCKIFFYPLLKFQLNYFIRLGFLDGVAGLIHAIMMSFHSYLTWSKLYLLWHKK